ATVRVDRVLKQSPTGPTSSIRFHFARPDEFVGWGAVNPLSYGMFFLVDEHGELNLTSPYQPSLPASPDANVKWGTPIERVTGELGAILESSTASAQQRQSIVYLLSTSNDPSALAVLRPFANVSDVSLRLSVA